VLLNHLDLFWFIGPDAEVNDILEGKAGFAAEIRGEACKGGNWHAMHVGRRGRRRGVGIDVCIDPENLGVGDDLLHTLDGADSLRVVTSENERKQSVAKGALG